MKYRRVMMVLVCMGWCLLAHANAEPIYGFSSPSQTKAFDRLTHELRCLVCQNQSIADSQAPMAADLRRYIARHLQQGQSAEGIKQQLLHRYGEYLSFAPLWHGRTYVLWMLPAGLMVLVMVVMVLGFRRGQHVACGDRKKG